MLTKQTGFEFSRNDGRWTVRWQHQSIDRPSSAGPDSEGSDSEGSDSEGSDSEGSDSEGSGSGEFGRSRHRWATLRQSLAFLLVAGCLFFPSSQAGADEPFEQFLSRLREAGHYDVAEFYLVQMESSDLIGPELKKQIPFRRAQVLYDKTRTQRSDDAVESWKSAAQLALEFADSTQDLEQRLEAAVLISNARQILAKFQLQKAEVSLEEVHSQPEVATQVRQQYELSAQAFDKAVNWLREELLEARTSKDPQRRGNVGMNRRRFLAFMLEAENFRYKSTLTLDPESDEFKDRMTKIADESKENRQKYSSQQPYEMAFQLLYVKALAKLGRIDEAGPMLDDLFAFTSTPIYQTVRREAVLEGVEIWFNTDPPKTELAIEQLENVAAELPEDTNGDDVAQAILLSLAKAHHMRVTSIKELEKPTTDQRNAANFSGRRAEQLLRQLAKLDSIPGDQAKDLMKEWDLRGPSVAVRDIDSFSEARELGFETLVAAGAVQTQLVELPEGDAQRAVLQQQLQEMADEALSWLDRSFELVKADTRRADINMARVYQARCYWIKERYLETSLIGQYLLERFPNEIGTPEAAALAAQALNRMAIEGKQADEDVTLEQERMASICQEVLDRWPNSNEAGDLAYLLVTVAVNRDDLEAAVAAVDKLGDSNDRRANAFLLVGLAHVRRMQALAKNEQLTPALKEQLSTAGRRYLEQALADTSAEVSTMYFYGVSQLAQWHLEQQEYEQALKVLDSSPGNAIERIRNDDPLVAADDLQVNLIQGALLAELGKMSQSGSVDAQRGRELLQLLEDKVQDNPRRDSILQSFYALTLQKLKEQFQQNRNPESLEGLAGAMLAIFRPISEQSNDWRLLYSIGDTIADLRDQLPAKSQSLKGLNDLARSSFEKAASASQGSTEPNMDAFRLEFQLGAASAYRASGQYSQAETKLKSILTNNTNNPKLQIALSQLYLDWGEATKDTSKLKTALSGGLPLKADRGREKNQMWGWQKLAQATLGQDNLKSIFYNAFFGLNKTKLAYLKINKDKRFGESALKDIRNQLKRDAQLGGPGWKAKLDQLTREIQKEMGQNEGGLKSL